jgi:hypothetical protein
MSRALPAGGAAIRSFAEAQDLWLLHTGASALFRISAGYESPLFRVYAAGENIGRRKKLIGAVALRSEVQARIRNEALPPVFKDGSPSIANPRVARAALGSALDVVIEVPRGSFVKRGSSGSIDFISPLPCPFNYWRAGLQAPEVSRALVTLLQRCAGSEGKQWHNVTRPRSPGAHPRGRACRSARRCGGSH